MDKFHSNKEIRDVGEAGPRVVRTQVKTRDRINTRSQAVIDAESDNARRNLMKKNVATRGKTAKCRNLKGDRPVHRLLKGDRFKRPSLKGDRFKRPGLKGDRFKREGEQRRRKTMPTDRFASDRKY